MIVVLHNSATHKTFGRQSEHGQSMVEFAFLLLPFLFATIAVIEIGRAWSVKQAITNAAREGARVLVLPYGEGRSCPDIDCTSAAGVEAAARNTVKFYLSSAGIGTESPITEITLVREVLDSNGVVTTEPLGAEPQSGDLVGVKIRYEYSSILQGFFAADTGMINLGGMSVMRHE